MRKILLPILLLVMFYWIGTAYAATGEHDSKHGVAVILLKAPQYMDKDYYRCLEKLGKSKHTLVFGADIQAEYEAYRHSISQSLQPSSVLGEVASNRKQTLQGNLYRMTQGAPGTVVVISPEVFATLPPEVAEKFTPYTETNPPRMGVQAHEPTIQELLNYAKISSYEKILYIMAFPPQTYTFNDSAHGGLRAIVEVNAFLCDSEKIIKVCSTAKRDSTKTSMFNMGNVEKSSIKGAFNKCIEAISKAMDGLL